MPVQALTSSAPHISVQAYGGTLVQTQFPAYSDPPTSGQSVQRAASSALQVPVQTGASIPVQRLPAQSSPPVADQHCQLAGTATRVVASTHTAGRLGQPTALSPPVRLTGPPDASPHKLKLSAPPSPLTTSASVDRALERAAEAPGQRAAQADQLPETTSRQSDARDAGHDKAVADDADEGSEVKPSNEVLQPSDRALGTGQIGQLSQEPQQAKSPFKSVLRSPLHHDKPWEDTDDEEDVLPNGEPNEMDWERHITASANPEPAGARSASAENGHQGKGMVVRHPCTCSNRCPASLEGVLTLQAGDAYVGHAMMSTQ